MQGQPGKTILLRADMDGLPIAEVQYSYVLYSYGLYSYGLYSCGLYNYGGPPYRRSTV